MNLGKGRSTQPPEPDLKLIAERLRETPEELKARLADEKRSFHEKRKRDSKENNGSSD